MIYSICKCDTRQSVRYLMRKEAERFGKGLQAILLRFKAKPLPAKHSVKFNCQI